jgi:hypothetical protein
MGIFDKMADNPAPFRAEAERCRDLAARLRDGDDRRLMLRLANENDARALFIDAVLASRRRASS